MNKIGDMVCTIPLIKTIKKNFNNPNITVLTEELPGKFLNEINLVDEIIIYKKNNTLLHNRYLEILHLINRHKI
ncbi:MAG: hypothetical protein ABDH19_08280 [Thermodesulfovibrio sp.]